MRILPSNKFLLKCKLVNSSLCDLCCMSEETIRHLFWECPISRNFWNSIDNFMKNKGINIEITYKEVSLCSTNCQIFNFIVILAKYFIFKNKYAKTIPNFNCFIEYIFKRKDIEKIIALKKDKLDSHNKKWSKIN